MCAETIELSEKFKQPSVLRTFRIVTKTDDIFINLSYLAELSEYFHIICTSQFCEKNANEVVLPDIEADDLIQFLAYVCPDKFTITRRITSENIFNLAYFSDRLMFPQVKADIKQWVASEQFKNDQLAPSLLVETATILNDQGFNMSEMEPIFKKMALIDEDQMETAIKTIDQSLQDYFMDKIRIYKPYKFNTRPNSYFHYEDYRRRIFF